MRPVLTLVYALLVVTACMAQEPQQDGHAADSHSADAQHADGTDAEGADDTAARHQHASGSSHDGGMVHDFSDAEAWSKRFDDPERDAWQRPAEVVEHLQLSAGMTVADIGAGTGYFVPYLAPAVGDSGLVLGLDVEPEMVEFLAARAEREGFGQVEARTIATDDPGLEANSVDRILIVNTWHHIGDRVHYGEKMRRALTKGGAVYVVDFTLDSPSGPAKHHRLSPEQVIAELAAAGFEADVIEETLPRQYIIRGR